MDKPRSRVLRALGRIFYDDDPRHRSPEKGRPMLGGLSAKRLDDKQDLVAVRNPTEKDILSRFLQDNWIFEVSETGRN